MLRTNDVAVLDIGSEKITVFYGNKSVNDTFNVKASVTVAYSGFADGEWLDEESLSAVFQKAVDEICNVARVKIRKFFIGVPGEFTTVVAKEVGVVLDRKRRIVDSDIDDLFDKGNTYKDHKRYATINCASIYYTLDDNRRLIEPRGLVADKLKALVSYVLCERNFLNTVNGIMKSIGVCEVEFISSSWAESMYLIDEDSRDKSALLVDIGYITSSVMVVRGDGLLYMSSFSCGGAHITGDITLGLDIPYAHAEQLKAKLDLNRELSFEDRYTVSHKDKQYDYLAVEVNEIAKARITFLAQAINKCLGRCEYDCPSHLPIYVTGGGVYGMRGAREIISKITGRTVEFIGPRDPNYSKPYFSSTLGVMDIATRHSKESESIFKKLFKTRR